ncbi:MAG: hypothetical protein SGARI_004324 [Bacillariaceae sp.]
MVLAIFLLSKHSGIHAVNLRLDPDTTCREVYRKTHTKEACMAATDHYGRPCAYCDDHGQETMCYNADEARWAKIFGDTCETKEGDVKMAQIETQQQTKQE